MTEKDFKCTLDNVIFKFNEKEEKKSGSIILTKDLTRETDWYDVIGAGKKSIVCTGDKILMSTRMTTYEFEVQGMKVGNTEDKSIIAVKRITGNMEHILATAGTIIYEWLEDSHQETKTESGIILIQKEATKEKIVAKAKVIAAGPNTEIQAGDIILIAFNPNAYKLEKIIEGKVLHNVGAESVIMYWRE